jgi:hypothetical protein
MPDLPASLARLDVRILVGALAVAYCALWLLAKRLPRGAWSSQGRGGHVRWDQDGPVGAAFLSSGTCAKVKAWPADPSGRPWRSTAATSASPVGPWT